MSQDISIVHPSADGLSETEWRFRFSDYYGDARLILSFYAERSRETRRHKMKGVRWWDSSRHRDDTMTADVVPLPGGVAEQAKSAFMAGLTVRGPGRA